METVIIQTNSAKNAQILRSLAKALGDKILKSPPKSPYNPAFVKKIRQSEKQIAAGKIHKVDLNDIWK